MVILVSADVKLDKNSFYKLYARARIAANTNTVRTTEGLVYPDQIWMLEESNRARGYYYINSAQYPGYRLADSKRMLAIYNGQYFEDQLWRLQKEGDYYRIFTTDIIPK